VKTEQYSLDAPSTQVFSTQIRPVGANQGIREREY
jgi:hypothetical protein